ANKPRDESAVGSAARLHLAESSVAAEATPRSAETSRFQVIIGLNNLPQARLRTPIAAIGIGMVPLYQDLVLRLDIGAFGIGFKAENIERAALRVENLALLGRDSRMTVPRPPHAKDRERIVSRPVGVPEHSCRTAGALAADRTHLPGRTVTGQRLLLVFGDGIFAHAGEKIVRIIIFTDMLEAELPVFAGAQPAFRRAMGRRRFASGPLAAWELIAQAVLFGLNPDPVEQW